MTGPLRFRVAICDLPQIGSADHDLEGQSQRTSYRQQVRLWVGCLLGVLGLGSLMVPASSSACVRAGPVLHEIDANLATTDDSAPTPPADVTAEVVRRLGRECDGDSCLESSCGDTGQVVVQFTLSTDDQSGPAAIGYQLEAAEGALLIDALKIGATRALDTEVQGTGMLRFDVGFDLAETLDTTAQLVAIDAAGNPSAASNPFVIKFDGCTRRVASSECAQTEDEAASCSLSAPIAHPIAHSGAAGLSGGLLLLGVALGIRRAKQRL